MAHNNISNRNSLKDKISKLAKIKKPSSGLKTVHIGKDEWKVGRTQLINDPLNKDGHKVEHTVIYSPNRKEFHVYGQDNRFLKLDHDDKYSEGSYCNRHGNDSIESSVKIYILTSILDKRANWCFDIGQIPQTDKLKVIYHNGTVKNIDFKGVFESVEVQNPHTKYVSKRNLRPVGYRIP